MRSDESIAPLITLRQLYDDVEIAIVLDWLGIDRHEELARLDVHAGKDADTDGVTFILPDHSGQINPNGLSNAAARLMLQGIQRKLPQWGSVHTDGSVTEARESWVRRAGQVEPLPRFLFQINWADSGPGYSWPESYYATWLPGFDRYVVTASQDSPEAHGYTDEAIGWFEKTDNLAEGAKESIINWWRSQALGWDQHRWEYLFQDGIVGNATAWKWAAEVWDRNGEPWPDARRPSTEEDEGSEEQDIPPAFQDFIDELN